MISMTHSKWLGAVRRALTLAGYRFSKDIDLLFEPITAQILLVKWVRIGIEGPRTGKWLLVEKLPYPPDWVYSPEGERLRPIRVDAFIFNFIPQIEHVRHGLQQIKGKERAFARAREETRAERNDKSKFIAKRDQDAALAFRARPFVGEAEHKLMTEGGA